MYHVNSANRNDHCFSGLFLDAQTIAACEKNEKRTKHRHLGHLASLKYIETAMSVQRSNVRHKYRWAFKKTDICLTTAALFHIYQ